MYKILIVEDDETIRNGIKTLLELQGYYVDIAVNGVDGLKKFDETYSLVIMDIIMPLLSGIDACKKLREESSVPILFLTAKSSEIDIMQGFEVGGDDYLVKPFSNMELLMRVKAILRRSSGAKVPVVTEKIPFADLILDTESRSVSRQGEMIPLTYTEFQILELLVTHKKKIYSLENIYQSIWGEDAVGDSAIMVHIKNIRKKLGDDSRNPKYIKTAWGRGYYVDQ